METMSNLNGLSGTWLYSKVDNLISMLLINLDGYFEVHEAYVYFQVKNNGLFTLITKFINNRLNVELFNI